MGSCDRILVGYSNIFMREVIISQIVYGFVQKADFEGWSWFNFDYLELTPGMALKIYSSVAKRLKLKIKKCWGKLEGSFLHFPSPAILNSIKNDLADSRPVKTIKKEKYIGFIT